METLFIYIVKSSGLITLFYLSYYLLLRKETFFTTNRWFLVTGLFTSAILPLVVYTTVVLVEPTPVSSINWTRIPSTTPIGNESFQINWFLILAVIYAIGIILFLLKFAFDFYSLNRVLKGKPVQQQADFKFIDLKENVAPFSYFNTIVYNSSLYSSSELENILEHEKVHSDQNHTFDVLIARTFCIAFWFNPFIWLYKKAILQNLEFIADSEATKNISDKKAYQLTLLKITTHENCVEITNHFYQSLIKKRIVMLNKNQSKKWNSWKYVLILPLLVTFVFLFQIKVIAQEKVTIEKEIKNTKSDLTESGDIYKIKKTTTDKELDENKAKLKENHGITATFSKIKRNSNDELTGIKVKLEKDKEAASTMEINSSEPLADFEIIIAKKEDGTTGIDFFTDKKGKKKNKDVVSTIYNIRPPHGLPGLPPPPAPPVFPSGEMPNVPEIDMSKMPAPPVHPADIKDKKAMAQFKKEMDEFEEKMEAFEPDMSGYEKTIEEEMEKRQAIFEKQMKKYELAMQKYEEVMKKFEEPNEENND